jgi:hypothetical protein
MIARPGAVNPLGESVHPVRALDFFSVAHPEARDRAATGGLVADSGMGKRKYGKYISHDCF